MPMLELKPTSKPIGEYYASLAEFNRLGVSHEMAVRSAFQRLLEFSCKKVGWTFIGEFKYKRPKRKHWYNKARLRYRHCRDTQIIRK
jgi:hypothetical protein